MKYLQIKVLKPEIDDSHQINLIDHRELFDWNITDHTSQDIKIKMIFKHPELLSRKLFPDRVLIHFTNAT